MRRSHTRTLYGRALFTGATEIDTEDCGTRMQVLVNKARAYLATTIENGQIAGLSPREIDSLVDEVFGTYAFTCDSIGFGIEWALLRACERFEAGPWPSVKYIRARLRRAA